MTSEIFVQKTKPFYNYLTNLKMKKKFFSFFFLQNFEPWTLVSGIRYSTLYATENIIILIQNCHGWSKNFFYLFSEITCNGEKIERNFFLTPPSLLWGVLLGVLVWVHKWTGYSDFLWVQKCTSKIQSYFYMTFLCGITQKLFYFKKSWNNEYIWSNK